MGKNILHIIAIITLLFAFNGFLYAQSSVTGIVKSGPGGSPVSGATVTILETSTSTTTDPSGQYILGVATGQIRTLVVGSVSRSFSVKSGVNQMNFWIDAVTDVDGNKYSAVEIGTQVWMVENFLVTHFRDGTSIPNVTDNTTWGNLTSSGYCWYNNDATINKDTYGGLYNYFTVKTGNLCPMGWHVPTYNEWYSLALLLDPSATNSTSSSYMAGGPLKEAGSTHWLSPNAATNETGFSALPSGWREYNGAFTEVGHNGHWWSSTNAFFTGGWAWDTYYYNTQFFNNAYNPVDGISVRCLLGAVEPILTTTPVSELTSQSAKSGGDVTSDGSADVTASGVCWNTGPAYPTITNDHTTDFAGIGGFTSSISGLAPSTNYYIRAYATNSEGKTGYGNVISIRTLCPSIAISTTQYDATCFGTSTGSVTAVAAHGKEPYSYSWNTSPVQNTATATNLSAGTYTVTVIDANLCTASITITIGQQPVLSAKVASTNVACSGMSDGTITISGATGGSGAYEYSISGGVYWTSFGFFEGLNVGDYNVLIRDAAHTDCVVTLKGVSIILSDQPTATVTWTNVTCYGANDGAIYITDASGGSGNYLYSINGSETWQGDGNFTGLAPHSYPYEVEIRDAAHPYCSIMLNEVNITQPDPLSATLASTNITCNGANDGIISISNPAGGSGTFEYSINGTIWQSTGTFTNLGASIYNVQIRDVAQTDCIITLNGALEITQPAVLSATVGATGATCFGSNDGTINIKDPSGGHCTYEYRLDTGPWQAGPQFSFSNLAPANYSVQIRDASFPSCIVTLNNALTITQPIVLSATVGGRNVTCFGANDGTIGIKSPSGGHGTYEYSIDGGSTWQISGSFNGLSPANYNVQIRDALYTSCVATLDATHTITQPPVLSGSVTHSDVICNGASDGTIIITATGGYGTYEYSINGGSTWETGGTYTGLPEGNYKVRIRDLTYPTCMLIINDELGISQPGVLSATVASTNVTCNGANDGTITISNPSGGYGTYEYTIDGGTNWQASMSYSGLAPGNYNVQVRDAGYSDCAIPLNAALSITQPDVLNASGTVISQSCNGCNDAAINLTVSGGTTPYFFAWTGPDGYSSTNQTITSLKPDSYSVVVTDAHSCTKTIYAEVINPFVVTNVNDDGIGSLRYAINYANTNHNVTPNLITFNIPLGLTSTIQPLRALPEIMYPLVIDGYSQPGTSLNNLILSIELEGSKAGVATNGLTIKSNNCTVKGLIIDGFTGNGIQVASGTGNTISANSIFDNSGLGIDLGTNSAVTPNDLGDADGGPNNSQNFPVLGNLSFSPGNVTVTGTLNSLPTALTYKLEFFANKVTDNTGYGEGQTYLGSTTVITDVGGNATFAVTLPTLTKYGDVITATATDLSGNTSEFSQAIGGLQDQILSSTNITFHYQVNGQGVKSIPATAVVNEVISAFGNWTGIATSSMSFINDKTTTPPPQYASASDNINLVTFTDDKFPFSPGILAVTAKTLKIGTNDKEAQIMDADIVFNPYFVNNSTYDFGIADNPLYPGFFDIQNVTTHEIGHILGLLHSGVYSATMWFEVGPGITDRSLDQDDKSWLSYRYPEKTIYDQAFGSISGNIKYGYNNDPVAGAIVLAVDPVTNLAVVHAYSDVNGNYLIPALPPGSYRVYIMPLDGDVYGRDLRPGNISAYIYSNTFYTDYPGEFYNYPDQAVESNPTPTPTPVTVIAGKETSGIDLLTNKDVTVPTVKSVVPASGTTGVSVLPNILITFSEPVDINTLTGESCYLTLTGGSIKIGGKYKANGFEGNSDIILFTLTGIALDYGSDYTLHITTGVTDLKTNQLGGEYTSTFHTEVKDTEHPTIKSTIPENKAVNIFLTDKIMVFFSEPMIQSTVESSFILTTDNGTVKVDCTPSWDGYATLTLSPKSPLIEGKNYFLTWTNTATDLSRNGLAAGSIYFSTIPTAPPTITYLEPGTILTTNVAVETTIVVDFSEPIDVATVDQTTFKLLSGTSQVLGSFEFLNENSRVVFRPSANLSFGQTYTINLTNGIWDVSQVKQNFAGFSTPLTFTTATKPSKPHIDYIDPLAGAITNEIFISGSGFDPNPAKNKVTFSGLTSSGVDAFAHEASLTWIKVYIPYGAVSGAIRVTVNGVLDDQDPNNLMTYIYIGSITDLCNTATGNIGTGAKPRDGAVDFNGANAYITNSEDNSVSVITDLNTNAPYLLTSIQVGTTPVKIEINPKGTRAYVTNFDSHNVSVIDLTDANGKKNQVVQTINVGLEPFGVVAYGDKVYVANYGSDNITVINADPTSGGFDHAVANINTGTHNRDCDISPDGGTLVVTGEKGLTLIKMTKTATGFDYAVSNANSGTSTRDVAVTPNGGTAIVTTNDGGIFFVDIAPGDNFGAAYGNTNPGSKPGDGKVTFDGAYYYVTNPDDNKVTVYKITFEGSGSGSGTISSSAGLTLKEYATINVGDSPEGIAMDAASDRAIVVNSGSNNITPITICCPAVKTAFDYIKDLAFTVQQLMYQGTLSRTSAGMLIGRLNDASLNILRNKSKTAVNNLNTFINKVNSLMNSGKLDKTTGKDLIKIAEKIISMLQNPINAKSFTEESIISSSDRIRMDAISQSKLGVIYPNPFQQSVTINYEISEDKEALTKVQIIVYDENGRLISTLVDQMMQSGCYTTSWNGDNDSGGAAPYGTYFVLFRAGTVKEVSKIVLIKPR